MSTNLPPGIGMSTEDDDVVPVPGPPYISVVIPCFNSRLTLGACLDALEQQSYDRKQFEIIVADNGSTDGSLELLASRVEGVKVVNAQEKGSGYARNAGNAVAQGEFILSTDADCVPDRDWIATLVSTILQEAADVAAIGGLIRPYSTASRLERYDEVWISQGPATFPNGSSWVATPNAIFRKEPLRAVGGYDGTLGFDDTDLSIRLQTAGFRIAFTDAAIVRHRNPATIRELYRHRRKYGQAAFALAMKHPALLGDPRGPRKRSKLLAETAWRIAKDVIKLPVSLLSTSSTRPAGWPVFDAVIAWANYQGFVAASLAMAPGSGQDH